MGFSHLAKKENLLETLVGGGCPNCASEDVTVRRFLNVNKIYTGVTCGSCSFDEVFQAKPGDHLQNKHLF